MKKKHEHIHKEFNAWKTLFGFGDWTYKLNLHEQESFTTQVEDGSVVYVVGEVESIWVNRHMEVSLAINRSDDEIIATIIHELLHVVMDAHLERLYVSVVQRLSEETKSLASELWAEEEEAAVRRLTSVCLWLNGEEDE